MMNISKFLSDISKNKKTFCSIGFSPTSSSYYTYILPENLIGSVKIGDCVKLEDNERNGFVFEIFDEKDLKKHSDVAIKNYKKVISIDNTIKETPVAIVEYRKGGKQYVYTMTDKVKGVTPPAEVIVLKSDGEAKVVYLTEVIKQGEAVERGLLIAGKLPAGKIVGKV